MALIYIEQEWMESGAYAHCLRLDAAAIVCKAVRQLLARCRMPAEDDPKAAFGEELSDTDSEGRIRREDGNEYRRIQGQGNT